MTSWCSEEDCWVEAGTLVGAGTEVRAMSSTLAAENVKKIKLCIYIYIYTRWKVIQQR